MTGRRLRVAIECIVVTALLASGFWYGNFAASQAATPPDYHYLSPAISVAVGKGFHTAVPVPGSPLDDFLARRSMTLAWQDAVDMPIGPPDRFHETTRYLINTVGYWWRISGISWTSIGQVGAALHAMTVVGAYALIRLFLPLPLAVVGALWICTSTLQLALVPHVRDYSKGAFIVGVLPLLAVLALRPLSRRALMACAAAAGGLIGLGLGFKMDVAIMAPLAVASIVLSRGRRPWTDLGEKAQVVGVLLAALLLAAGPLLYRLSAGGSNSFHVILLGFADGFDANLGIERSVYAFLPFYNDGYLANVIQGHSGQLLGFPSPEYDAAGQAMFLEVFRKFPADLFVRALGAANAVMNLCFLSRDPSFLVQPLPAQPFFLALYSALYRLNGFGIVLAPLFLVIASWNNLRRGLLAMVVLLILAGYPSLQFESRHYFHAQIVPVVALLAVVGAAGHMAVALASRRLPHFGLVRSLAVPIAVMLALTVVPLVALRAYQSSQLDQAVTAYLNTRVPLQTSLSQEDNGSWLVSWPQPAPPAAMGGLRAAHYIVEFADDGSGEPIHVSIRYDVAVGQNYSRLLTLAPVAGANRVGFSVFTHAGQSDLAGVELGDSARRRLAGVYRVDTGGLAGLPLDVRLPADWRDRPLYQRLQLERDDPRAMAPQPVTCANGPGCRGLLGYLDRLPSAALPLTPAAIDQIYSDIVHPEAAQIVIDGRSENESSYLLQLKEVGVASKAAFVVAGHLREGGVAIGLLKDRAWYKQALIQTPGPFVAVIGVDGPGNYTPLVTNAMPPGRRENHLIITQAGVMEPR